MTGAKASAKLKLIKFSLQDQMQDLFRQSFNRYENIMSPRVSVIIPTYKRAAKVACAVADALNQTYRNIEVIVVDDAGGDTQARLSAISDPRLVVVTHEQNFGVSEARNTGIGRARGDIIAFLDDDDSWTPDKLEIQLRYMDESFPDCEASVTDYMVVTDKSKYLYRPSQWHNLYRSIILGDGIAPSTLMVKRKVFEIVGGFDPKLSSYEDIEWFIRYLEYGKVGFVPQALATYNGAHPFERESPISSLQHILSQHQNYDNSPHRRLFRAKVLWWMAAYEMRTAKNYANGMKRLMMAFASSPLQTTRLASGFMTRRIAKMYMSSTAKLADLFFINRLVYFDSVRNKSPHL